MRLVFFHYFQGSKMKKNLFYIWPTPYENKSALAYETLNPALPSREVAGGGRVCDAPVLS